MHDRSNQLPTRRQALLFSAKVKLLQGRRMLMNLADGVSRHPRSDALSDAPVIASSSTPLWTEEHAAERDLTAGKVQNLRLACQALHGTVIPAGEVFSFWKQMRRTTRGKGYVVGRELREGCIIPNLGGGLCQLSNGLYNAALKAGCRIVERHAHSQVVAGSLAAVGRDATVFWNYVDLRFSYHAALRLEASLSKNHLHIRFLSEQSGDAIAPDSGSSPQPIEEVGNCFSCNVGGCFRNAPQDAIKQDLGRTAVLLDSYVPEFQQWLNTHLQADDRVLCPINARRYRAPAYRWKNPTATPFRYATALTLLRSLRLRFLPQNGGALQRTLMEFDQKLAANYARRIDFRVTHLIVSQNLLPHLWRLGVMGGRTFDVLATRYPLGEIQSRLNFAHTKHARSSTLNDFRVDASLCEIEQEALSHAQRIFTAHHGVADAMPGKVTRLPWVVPQVEVRSHTPHSPLMIGFPASPLGKKGVYELQEALQGMDVTVLVLGNADEGVDLPNSRQASLSEIMQCDLVVLPAHIEHSPRPLLRALAMGVPVIATKACGLPAQEGLTLLEEPDVTALRKLIQTFAQSVRP
ncbi:VanW family protein [Verrucomicrobiaceae bacterium R5-34]|nr:VanW family protein [Verrucomicrobiaceae bacterium R5-34]